MNHHHRKVLHSLFSHPISNNIDFKEVQSLLKHLGAEIDERSGSRVAVTLNGHTVNFHHAQHSLHKDQVVGIRDFLTECGVKPEEYPV